jgi:uncharacterized membrane protein YcgQ (UPF0703/DUF1980 family)
MLILSMRLQKINDLFLISHLPGQNTEYVIVNFSYIFYLYCFLFILLKFKFNLMIFKRQKRGKNRHHFILLMLKFNEAKLTVLMAH